MPKSGYVQPLRTFTKKVATEPGMPDVEKRVAVFPKRALQIVSRYSAAKREAAAMNRKMAAPAAAVPAAAAPAAAGGAAAAAAREWLARRARPAANPIPAPASEEDRDGLHENVARIRAIHERNVELEELEHERKRGAHAMREEFVKDVKMAGQCEPLIMERHQYRAYVLSHSLFPNVFNHHAAYTYGGAS